MQSLGELVRSRLQSLGELVRSRAQSLGESQPKARMGVGGTDGVSVGDDGQMWRDVSTF